MLVYLYPTMHTAQATPTLIMLPARWMDPSITMEGHRHHRPKTLGLPRILLPHRENAWIPSSR